MTEEFLQFIWKYQLFQKNEMLTTSGKLLEVIKPGKWNSDSGPDFFNATIKIGDTVWVGNVEVHRKSSDWIKHNHQTNEAYNNVILHVVAESDLDIQLSNGEILPAFILKAESNIESNYQQLISEEGKPACYKSITKVDSIYVKSAINSLLVERLQTKTLLIEERLNQNKNDWNETFYQFLAANFGFKINALPFEMLARSLPIRVLAHHSNNLMQLEALLFGQSGLLNEELLGDDYFIHLRDEYSYLSKKYDLKGLEGHIWKFMRIRPANFPTVRLAQFAALLHQSKSLFSLILETEKIATIQSFFNVKASEYWNTHYRFNMESNDSEKILGKGSRANLLINTVVPFLYLYGQRNNKEYLKNRAFELLEVIPSEQNAIIERWAELGIKSGNAYDSQALIQLKNVYCDYKLCLKCQIGNKVINR